MAKLNIVSRNGKAAPECTACGKRFEIENYHEMVAIARGRYKFCPKCGERITDVQVEGVDFNECEHHIRVWASNCEAGLLPWLN